MRKKDQSSKELAKKYKLEDLLINQPYHKYLQSINELPELIGKSRNTLTNYRNILIDSKEMIPYEVGIIIERYFGIEPGTLSNI